MYDVQLKPTKEVLSPDNQQIFFPSNIKFVISSIPGVLSPLLTIFHVLACCLNIVGPPNTDSIDIVHLYMELFSLRSYGLTRCPGVAAVWCVLEERYPTPVPERNIR